MKVDDMVKLQYLLTVKLIITENYIIYLVASYNGNSNHNKIITVLGNPFVDVVALNIKHLT